MSAPAEKIYLRVLRAVVDGAETAREVGDEIGMDPGRVCAHLTYLSRQSLAERSGLFWRHDSRQPVIRWRPTEAGRAAA